MSQQSKEYNYSENANKPLLSKEKGRGNNTKKEPEPLIELLYQEFPKTDPVDLERITKRVKQWLEQKRKYFEKLSNQVARKCGENATETYVSKAYPRCLETLLQELDPEAYPLRT